jgi:hypothetical protein
VCGGGVLHPPLALPTPPPPHFPAGSVVIQKGRLFVGLLVPSWLSPSQLFKQQDSENSMRSTSQRLFFSAAVHIHAKKILADGLNKSICKTQSKPDGILQCSKLI